LGYDDDYGTNKILRYGIWDIMRLPVKLPVFLWEYDGGILEKACGTCWMGGLYCGVFFGHE
jgi:hypothetical protein